MGYRCGSDQSCNEGQQARRNCVGARTVRCTDTKMKARERETKTEQKAGRGKGDSCKEKMKET